MIAIGAGSRRELREMQERRAEMMLTLRPGDTVAEQAILALDEQIAHLRARTNKYGALARMRSRLSFAIHQFFQRRG